MKQLVCAEITCFKIVEIFNVNFQDFDDIPADPKLIEIFMKMKKQMIANQKMSEKVENKGVIDQLDMKKLFDEGKIHQVLKNIEYGGSCTKMVSLTLQKNLNLIYLCYFECFGIDF